MSKPIQVGMPAVYEFDTFPPHVRATLDAVAKAHRNGVLSMLGAIQFALAGEGDVITIRLGRDAAMLLVDVLNEVAA